MRAGLAVLVALSVVLSLCVGCNGSTRSDTAPDLAAITAYLARYSAAMTGHSDRTLAGLLDGSGAGRTFRAAQLQEHANLQAVPLQHWQLTASALVHDLPLDQLHTRYGASVTVAHLQLSYQLRGIDPGSSIEDLWWTFLRRDGSVRAVSADDLDALGGQSWRGPWQFGPILTATAPGALAMGPVTDPDQVRTLSALVSSSVPVVSSVWGTSWARAAAVVVPQNATEFAALSGSGSGTDLSDEAARTLIGTADPSTGLVSGTFVIINPAQFDRLTQLAQRQVIVHELTHVASAADSAQNPRWLVEGLAEYVSHLADRTPVRVAAQELAAQVRAGRLPTTLPTDAQFAAEPAVAYELAWQACAYLVTRIGNTGLVRLYRLVDQLGQTSADTEANLAQAVHSLLRESIPTLLSGWRSYLLDRLR